MEQVMEFDQENPTSRHSSKLLSSNTFHRFCISSKNSLNYRFYNFTIILMIILWFYNVLTILFATLR